MLRVVVDHYSGLKVVQVVGDDNSRPGPGEVRGKFPAAGVSFVDSLRRTGTYLDSLEPYFPPGCEPPVAERRPQHFAHTIYSITETIRNWARGSEEGNHHV